MGSESVNAYSLKFTRQSYCYCSVTESGPTLCCSTAAACQPSMSFTISWSLLKLISVELMMPSNHLILCRPPSPSPLNLSQHQGPFQWVCSSHQVAKYWSFNFSICPSKEYWGLISFRINWFDLLGTWETLKSLLQHHSLKASVLWWSDLFMNQLSHPYMTTGKTIALTTWTFVAKVISAFHYTV